MPQETVCPQCRKPLPANAPEELCPACLMQQAMRSDTIASQSVELRDLEATLSIGAGKSAPHQDIPPGSMVGSYRIERKLGEGGMGAVYEATDRQSNRRVALKILKHKLNSAETRTRFLREGRTAASVNHPNSVYVYGTDDVDGKLVISMELVGRSNLQDVIRERGPMSYPQAVDAILQVIDGLEAAARAGVLHRDVKPSNCFVDASGTVKVGDFGLSISTKATEDSLATEDIDSESKILGTPAFSSPEQLRGDDLNVRSDIYSVGVTLFYLLTGKLPFTAHNFVQLLATVLENPAPHANEIKKDIPGELAQTIHRCLAKTPEGRFKDYEQLRKALLPFSSIAPAPANLTIRTFANLIDVAALKIVGVVLGLTLIQFSSGRLLMFNGLLMLGIYVLYYAVGESWRGQTLGKACLGLKVQSTNGTVPTRKQALTRAAIFVLIPIVFLLPTNLFFPVKKLDAMTVGLWVMLALAALSEWVLWAALFFQARSSNGFAAFHDRISGTRVVEKHVGTMHRTAMKAVLDRLPDLDETEKIGPYHVLQHLGKVDQSDLILGYDARLLRRVWIRHGADCPKVPAERRSLNRVGRLRWLNGSHVDKTPWDAFEAVGGKPLSQLLSKPQTWSNTRIWLLDLTTELAAAEQDGSLPPKLSLQNLWVTADGRMKVLDFVAPQIRSEVSDGFDKVFDTQQPSFVHDFLNHAVSSILRLDAPPRGIEFSRPFHATAFLNELRSGAVAKPIVLRKKLEALCRNQTTVPKWKKWSMLGMVLLLPAFTLIFMLAQKQFSSFLVSMSPATHARVSMERLQLDKTTLTTEDVKLLKVFIADYFGDYVNDKDRWSHQDVVDGFEGINPQLRPTIEQIVAANSGADDTLRKTAEERWASELKILKERVGPNVHHEKPIGDLLLLGEKLQHYESNRLAKIFFADKWGDYVRNKKRWDAQTFVIPDEDTALIESIVFDYSEATSEDLLAANEMYAETIDNPFGPQIEITPFFAIAIAGCNFISFHGIPAMACALLFGGGPLLTLFQLAVVRRCGKRAYRLQMLWRAFLWTLPALGIAAGSAGLFAINLPTGVDISSNVFWAAPLLFLSVAGPLASMLLMKRGLLDRLSGTYVVPR